MKSSDNVLFLALVQRALGKTTIPSDTANTVFEAVNKELSLRVSLDAFQKFCETGSLPDLEPATVVGFVESLEGNFGTGAVTVTPAEDNSILHVEITLVDDVARGDISIGEGEPENTVAFVPFPVAEEGDPELVYCLAVRENLAKADALESLRNIQEEFWLTKKGRQLIREEVPATFNEFIAAVSASALKESGIKRYHKDAETLSIIKPQVSHD